MEYKDLENIEVSPKVLCELLDFANPNYLSNLVNNHGFKKTARGKFPLVANIKRKFEYQEELHRNEIKKIREGNSRSRLETAQAGIKELELKEKQGELGPISEFKLALRNEALLFKKGLEALRDQLGFDINLTPDEKEILNNHINGLLNQIANLPADTNAENYSF